MEVWERHARTRAITRDTLSPANRPFASSKDASRDDARVVSDVSVLCPRPDVHSDNTPASARACARQGRARNWPSRRVWPGVLIRSACALRDGGRSELPEQRASLRRRDGLALALAQAHQLLDHRDRLAGTSGREQDVDEILESKALQAEVVARLGELVGLAGEPDGLLDPPSAGELASPRRA